MACLAWLLLAAVPVHGESMAMPSTHVMVSGMAMATSTAKGMHTTPRHVMAMATDCCASDSERGSTPSCHCAAMFSTVLASVNTVELLPVLPAGASDGTRNTVAPVVAYSPPLRPPAA